MEVEIDLATQLHQTRKEPERHEQNPGNCPEIVGLASYMAREKIVDIGAIYASRDKNHTVPLAWCHCPRGRHRAGRRGE